MVNGHEVTKVTEKLASKQQKEQVLQSVKNLHQLKDDENKSANELFNSISNRISALAGEKISETESREAARRYISFCQLIVGYKIRQTTQQVEEKAAKNGGKKTNMCDLR